MSKSQLKRWARRVAAPVTAPIDGRVADINRRVGDTAARVGDTAARVDRLEEAVSTFAEASTEATTYVGIELDRAVGRLISLEASIRELGAGAQESIRELGAEAQEDYYRRRIAEATSLPLSELEADLAAVLNHAAGYRGFAAQAELWFNPPLTVELSQGGARLASANERIAEVPFAMMALSRVAAGGRVLDVGSAESTFALSAASLGFQVTAVDPRGLPYEHPNLRVVAERFEDLPATETGFDAVFLISTIEHVGLPAYGIRPRGEVVPGEGADREILDRIAADLLAPDGFVVVTTPYGPVEVSDFERTYDDASLRKLLEGWKILQRVDVARHGPLQWSVQPPGEPVAEDGVAMVIARPSAT